MNTFDTYVQPLLDLVGRYPAAAALVVFLAALSEAIPVVGAVVPGSALVVGLGALVGLGHLPFWPILIAAILGAIFGDGLSYWFGRRYKAEALALWPLSRYPAMISASEAFFRRHGAKSVAIARFTPVVRAFVPLIAGISGMTPGRFYMVNVLSAVAWAPLHVLPGAALGASLGVLGAMSGRTLVLLAIVAVLAVALSWIVRAIWQTGVALLGRAQLRLFARLTGRRGRLVALLRDVLDPESATARKVVLLITVLATVILVLFNLVEDVLARGELARADVAIANLVTQIRTAWSDRILVFVTTLADTPITAAVALVGAAWLWWIGRRQLAFGLAALVAVTTLFALGLKASTHIARPNPIYVGAIEFSFPSGHATFATAIYGVLGWMLARDLPRPWTTVVLSLLGGLIGIVAVSRIYLGAHWPSDVTAGLLFGIGATCIFALVFGAVRLTSRERLSTAAVATLSFAIIGGWHVTTTYAAAVTRYAPIEHVMTLTERDWRMSSWMDLPARRVDLGGEEEEPLVLQWAGSQAMLASALARNGWHPAKILAFSTLQRFLVGNTAPDELPVIPKLNAGRGPDLTLVRVISNNERDVMRIWDSRFRVKGIENQPLLVASIIRERLEHPFGWITISRKDERANIDIAALLPLPNAVAADRPAPSSKDARIGRPPTTVLAGS